MLLSLMKYESKIKVNKTKLEKNGELHYKKYHL